MDRSALINAIAADSVWLDSLRPWLYSASVAVIIGLVIEVTPDIRRLHWWHWDNDLFIEVIGGAIVTVAIAAELFITFEASRAETKLRNDNALYVAFLEKEAANALSAASKANENAAKITREVGLRHLNGDTFLKILGTGPKGEYEIVYGAEDPDSILLAYDLRFLLERAGWKFISLTAVPLAELLSRKWASVITKNFEIEVHSLGMNETPILVPNLPMKQTLYSVLSGAIMAGLGGVQVSRGGVNPTLPANRVRITILPR
jgi:hypothetical protein